MIEQPTWGIPELRELIETGLAESFRVDSKRVARGPSTNVYASQWHACLRRMALDVAVGHTLPEWPVDVLARMVRGKEREVDLRRRLELAGKLVSPRFEVVGGEERFEIKGRRGQVVLTGRTDCAVKVEGMTAKLEIKSVSPFVAPKIRSAADWDKQWWTVGYPYQMLGYLLGSNTRHGFWLIDGGGTVPRLVHCDLYDGDNLQKAERFLQDAETATDAGILYRETREDVDALPPFCGDPAECARCPWFQNRCQPPIEVVGPEMGLSEEIIDAESVYWATRDAYKQHEAAAEALKDWAKKSPAPMAVVGGAIITKSSYFTTVYDVPANVKNAYASKRETTRCNIVRPGQTEED